MCIIDSQMNAERKTPWTDGRQGRKQIKNICQQIHCHDSQYKTNHAHADILGGGIPAGNQPINADCRRKSEQAIGYTGQERYRHSCKHQQHIKSDKRFQAHT